MSCSGFNVNTPTAPHTVCEEEVGLHCIGFGSPQGSDNGPDLSGYLGDNGSLCVRASLYETTANGLGNSPADTYITSTGWNPYSEVASLQCTSPSLFGMNVSDLFAAMSTNQLYAIVFEYGCCDQGSDSPPILNGATQRYYVEIGSASAPSLLAFAWTVAPNGPLDPDGDGTIENSSINVSTANRLGPITAGSNTPQLAAGNIATWGWTLAEVDCSSGAVIDQLYEHGPVSGNNLADANFNGVPINGQFGYFANPSNTVDKCFLFEYYADSGDDCGLTVQRGWFTIDQNCQGCYTTPPGSSTHRIEILNDAAIFPNPAQNVLRYSFSVCESPTSNSLIIVNSNGATLKSQLLRNDTGSIDISNLPPGSYVATLSSCGETWSTPFIKQ